MSSNALARVDMSPPAVRSRMDYAHALAGSGLLPEQYRRQPANVLLAIEQGAALGIAPITAINGINVIEGKPTLSPALMTALVRAAGHKVRTSLTGSVEGGDLTAVCTVIRADDPDHPFTSTWTLRRAERAELGKLEEVEPGVYRFRARTRKGYAAPWEKYTEAMIQHRAEADACRMGAEDVLQGVHYTPEELGANVNAEGEYIVGEVLDRPAEQRPQDDAHQPNKDAPAPTLAPEATPDAEAPQGVPQGVPDDVAEHMTRHALTVADMALTIGDADRVRQTYQDARERDYGNGPGAILRVDVYRALKFADLEPLGIPDDVERVELGALLIAVGKRLSAGQGPVRVPAADAAEGDGEDVVDAEVVDEPTQPSPQEVEQPPVEVDPWADGGGTAQAAQEARHEPKADPHGLRAAIRNGGAQDAEEGVRGDGWDKDEPPF